MQSNRDISWNPNPLRIGFGLLICAVIILLLSLVAKLAPLPAIQDLGFRRLLYVGDEGNIPATFSGGLLILACILLYVIGFVKRGLADQSNRQWLGIGILFNYLAIDELAGIHEMFNSIGLIFAELGVGVAYHGVLRWPWVIVGTAAVLIVSLKYARFVFALPSRTGILFVLAAFLFVSGAIGMEMLGGLFQSMVERGAQAPVAPAIVSHIEEALEMLGVILFIYALLDYAHPLVFRVNKHTKSIEISVRSNVAAQPTRD